MCDTSNDLDELKKCNALYCHACLSSDRALVISSAYVETLRKMCDYHLTMPQTDTYLCWECIAILRKIDVFKTKLIKAQQLLHYMHFNKQNITLNTLSNLTICSTNKIIDVIYEEKPDIDTYNEEEIPIDAYNGQEIAIDTYNGEQIAIGTYNGEEIAIETYNAEEKIDIEIKHEEIETDKIYEVNFCDNIKQEVSDTEQLSQENPKQKSDGPKCYKYIYNKTHDIIMKNIKINYEEAKRLMERDRNSDLFTKLDFKCMKCVQDMKIEKKLEEHITNFHSALSGTHKCHICSSGFKTIQSLIVHMKIHTKALQCGVCAYNCYSICIMKVHLKAHRSEVQCLACDLRLKNTSEFRTHYKEMHNSFICDLCGKRCGVKSMLEKHMRHTHNFATFRCEHCSVKFASARRLRAHVWFRHVAPKSAELAYCVSCDLQFETAGLYRRHLNSSVKHADERAGRVKKEPVKCPECPNVYARRQYMRNHYNYVHLKKTKYYCSECDRYFLNNTNLLAHIRYDHEGAEREKNKMCNLCGRKFSTTRTLVQHMRTHSGERPYECPHCDKGFAQPYAMKLHVKNVHGKRKNR